MAIVMTFQDVDEYVEYVTDVAQAFAEGELHNFIMMNIMGKAMDYIYDRAEPKVYRWTYTMVDERYYKTEFDSSPTVSLSDVSIDAYTYCNSPHIESVINGEPYDYYFEYYGVPRPFVKEANKTLLYGGGISKIKSRLVAHYNRYSLAAY